MYPPRNGARALPTAVAELKSEISSPRLVGNNSAIEASATGIKNAVANPW